jgi:hypothetical protein
MRNFFKGLDVNGFVARIESMRKYRCKLSRVRAEFHAPSPEEAFWNSVWLPPFDAITIYAFLAEMNPRYYVECGSGNTTKFAARSIKENNLRTKIISIDTFPRAEIDTLCHTIFRVPFEDMDTKFFEDLTKEDVFLVDNSHRSFPNSDVTVFFTEILPILPSGMLYCLHDIFLPDDYPEKWNEERRYYNEQYLLAAYLLGGAMGDSVYFPCCYASQIPEVQDIVQSVFHDGSQDRMQCEIHAGGGLFWLTKGSSCRECR